MKPVPDEPEVLPEVSEVDPVNGAIVALVELVVELTREDSPERKAAMTEVLAAAERIRAALKPKPRMN
jgi:hypothetical protein